MLQGCYFQCINGRGVLIASDCPTECPHDGGPCNNEGGIYVLPCEID